MVYKFLKLKLDLWNNIRGLNKSVDVLLSPLNFKKYNKLFDQAEIKFQVLNDNIQKYLNIKLKLQNEFKYLHFFSI